MRDHLARRVLIVAPLLLGLSACAQQSASPVVEEQLASEGAAQASGADCAVSNAAPEQPYALSARLQASEERKLLARAAGNSDDTVETLSVDAGAVTRRHAHLLGFQNGIYYNPTNPNRFDWQGPSKLIAALKPRIWGVGSSRANNDQYAFVVDVAKLPQTVGTEVVLSFTDFFPGYRPGVWVGANCPSDGTKGCFGTYSDLKSAWSASAEAFAQGLGTQYPHVAYVEVFNEPDWFISGLTSLQLFELFKIVHDAVQAVEPCVKVIGPALRSYSDAGSFGSNSQLLKDFLAYVNAHKLRLAAVNWHEFGPAPSISQHVAEIRAFMASQPGLCSPNCPHIYIMEYAGPTGHLIPGMHLGYLANMERAGVDRSGLGCWDVPKRDDDGSLTTYSDCWAGFGGMLLYNNRTPQAKYWESLAYVNLPLDRLAVQGSSDEVDAIAGRDDSKQQMQILVGRGLSQAFGAPPLPTHVTIVVNNYPYADPNVRVKVARIPKQFLKLADGKWTPVGMPQGPAPVSDYRDTVIDGTLTIALEGFGDGDVYSLTISSDAEQPAS